MKEIGAVIVDDEPPAREKLRTLVREDDRVRVVGEAGSGEEAVEVIERIHPDLVFLDIQMPEMDGFGVLEALEVEPFPRVIFVTAHDEHAVRAFQVRALDYLLKPVDPDRFAEALERVLESVGDHSDPLGALEELPRHRRRLERFLVRKRGQIFLVPVETVDWISAAGNYVKLHVGEDTHLVRGTLKELEERLPPDGFARIHRSTIVNLDRITAFHPWSHGDWLVVLEGGRELRLSRRYRDRLEDSNVFGP